MYYGLNFKKYYYKSKSSRLDISLSMLLNFNAHILNKNYAPSATCHFTAMQPCSTIALLLVIPIVAIDQVNGSPKPNDKMMDQIKHYLSKSHFLQHEKEKLSVLPLAG